MRVDILHAPFHADDFAAIVGLPVLLPARVIAVKPALIVWRKPLLRLGKRRQNQRYEQSQDCKKLLHKSSGEE